MRTVAIPVHNNQTLEVFVEKLPRGFELWLVGPVKCHRVVIDHHLTHDDLEAHLEYAEPGDLEWRDASPSEIPAEKHGRVIFLEKTIQEGKFLDFTASHESVTLHLSGSINFLLDVRKETKAAKTALLGQWSDGGVTLTLEPNNKMHLSCSDPRHVLREFANERAPDWWNFTKWVLSFLNDEHKCGTYVGVLRVDADELHMCSSHVHRLVDVFRRVKGAVNFRSESVSATASSLSTRLGNLRPTEGEEKATPLLLRLERAISERNPSIVERLKPGLPEAEIRAVLSGVNVTGDIEPIVQLYAWRNGTAQDEQIPMEENSLFPEDIYHFMSLFSAIQHREQMIEAAEQVSELFEGTRAEPLFAGISGSLFPLFFDNVTGSIAVDITSGKRNRVVLVEFEAEQPVRQLYRSFDAFIRDAIRANEEDDNLSCFQMA